MAYDFLSLLRPQDLIFADGTSLSSEFPCRNAKQAGVGLETGDLVTFVPRALGSAPPRTPDSTSPLGAHDDAPLVRGPKAGDVVTMTSDEKGAPPGIISCQCSPWKKLFCDRRTA